MTYLACGALSLIGAPAQADLILQLSDGTTTIDIADGSAADLNTATGVITFLGAVGSNWSINVSTALGTAYFPNTFEIDLNSANVSTGPGTLRVAMTETGLTLNPPGVTAAHVAGAVGGIVAPGSVSYALYTDNSNTAFGTGSTVFTGNGGSGPFSGTGSAIIDLSDPFSMTLVMNISHSRAGSSSFDFDATITVPEPTSVASPTSIALLGLGLMGLAHSRRRNAAPV